VDQGQIKLQRQLVDQAVDQGQIQLQRQLAVVVQGQIQLQRQLVVVAQEQDQEQVQVIITKLSKMMVKAQAEEELVRELEAEELALEQVRELIIMHNS
jgi:hypothetical protein